MTIKRVSNIPWLIPRDISVPGHFLPGQFPASKRSPWRRTILLLTKIGKNRHENIKNKFT